MLRIWSFCTIFIFLSVAYSAKGQEISGGSPLERALRWERLAYSSDDQAVVDSALLRKALCYGEAALPGEALRTLDRIRLYMLESDKVSEVLLLKSRFSREAGDMGAALGFLEESGCAEEHPGEYAVLLAASRRFPESKEYALACASTAAGKDKVTELFRKAPGLRKESTAAILSFLPPAGQIYLGRPLEGIALMLLNAGAVGFTVMELVGHDWITGLLGGGLLLNETFFKWNMERNISDVEAFNSRSAEEFAQSLDYLLNHSIQGSGNRPD